MHDECESTGIRPCRCSHGNGVGAMTVTFPKASWLRSIACWI